MNINDQEIKRVLRQRLTPSMGKEKKQIPCMWFEREEEQF